MHVGKNLEEQYEEYKGTKKNIEVFTMKFVCFSWKVVTYFLKIQEGQKFKEIKEFSRGTTSFFKLKLF